MKIQAQCQQDIQKELNDLYHRLRLGVVMLIELDGQVISFAGTESPPTELASLLAGMVAASHAITHRLGLKTPNQWAQWGENGGVVLLPVGAVHALAVMFHNHRFPGWVRMQAQTSATRIRHFIGQQPAPATKAQEAKEIAAGSRVGKLFGSVSDDEIDRLFSGV